MILIAGDSYCGFINEGTWPLVLSRHYNLPIVHASLSGGSWWTTRKLILKAQSQGKLDNLKIAIFVHTEGSRIANVDDFPIGGWIVDNTNWLPKEVTEASRMYYQYLHDPDYAVWTQQCWIKECENMFPDDVLTIHLHSFMYSFKKIKISRGVEVCPPLEIISYAEHKSMDAAFEYIKSGDKRKNHFTEENNLILGQELIKLIDSGQKSGRWNIDLSCFPSLYPGTIERAIDGQGDIIWQGKII